MNQTDAHADVDAASLVTCEWPLVFGLWVLMEEHVR